MFCKKAEYGHFRNIEEQSLTFDPGVNLLIGDNAQGKTNALEGLWLAASGRSHRAGRDRELLTFGEETGRIGIVYRDAERENELEIVLRAKGRRTCRKNGMAVDRMSRFIGNFRAVLFTPEHLSIVKDGPAMRRAFLDGAICQLSPAYVSHLQDYNRILMQRNRLLSDIAGGVLKAEACGDMLDVWTQTLCAEAEKIAAFRRDYAERMSGMVTDIFSDMTAGAENCGIVYSGAHTAAEYGKMLSEAREREFRAGTTLYGVHRDDLDMTINGRSVRSYGSQGQQRSVALAMKIAEGEISKETTGEYPVFLFDDILSELDEKRRDYILGGIGGRQVIITACDTGGLARLGKVIRCRNGTYREE